MNTTAIVLGIVLDAIDAAHARALFGSYKLALKELEDSQILLRHFVSPQWYDTKYVPTEGDERIWDVSRTLNKELNELQEELYWSWLDAEELSTWTDEEYDVILADPAEELAHQHCEAMGY